jgi:hypothetical protein
VYSCFGIDVGGSTATGDEVGCVVTVSPGVEEAGELTFSTGDTVGISIC